jgi:hypothetical protein
MSPEMADIAIGLSFIKDDSTSSIRADWLTLSRDGSRVVYSDFEGAKVRDMQTGALLRRFEGGGPVAFSPDGSRLVITGEGATLAVLDVVSGRRLPSVAILADRKGACRLPARTRVPAAITGGQARQAEVGEAGPENGPAP